MQVKHHSLPKQHLLTVQATSLPFYPPSLRKSHAAPQNNWPTSPSTVESSLLSTTLDLAIDSVLLALSLSFLSFRIIVRYYDQSPTESHPRTTSALVEATKYGPSVFPILFASVVGRAAQSIMLWRLETGERIGVLDMLAGSTSLTSAVTSQLKMRLLSILGILLITIWAFSPIGGQASFRQMTIESSTKSQPATHVYMKFNGDLFAYDNSDSGTFYAIMNSLFVSSLLAPLGQRSASVDTWGNVKIPMIETYENGSNTDDGQGWYDVQQSDTTYSSLIGIPINGLTKSVKHNLQGVETQYLSLDCPVVFAPMSYHHPNDTAEGTGCSIWSTDNSTARWKAGETVKHPRKMTFQSWGRTQRSECYIRTTYVEVDVSCGLTIPCTVSRIRRSRQNNPPPQYTLLDWYWQGWTIFSYAFATAVEGHPTYPTIMTNYLTNPHDPLADLMSPSATVDNTLPSKAEYEARLAQLMNTYWLIMNAFHAITEGLNDETATMTGPNGSDNIISFFQANTSLAHGTSSRDVPVIVSHTSWFVLLSVASLIMVFASLVHPAMRLFVTTAPDLMLNISSLATRDNAYFASHSTGTFLVASDRARLLKGVRVRFGDMDSGADVGVLGIGSLDSGGGRSIDRVRRGRKYK